MAPKIPIRGLDHLCPMEKVIWINFNRTVLEVLMIR